MIFKRIKVPEPYSHAVQQPVTAFSIYVNGNCPEFWGADLVKTRVGLPRLGKRSERSQQEIRPQEQAIATQQKLQQEEGELPSNTGRKRQHEMPHACQNARLKRRLCHWQARQGKTKRIQELVTEQERDVTTSIAGDFLQSIRQSSVLSYLMVRYWRGS